VSTGPAPSAYDLHNRLKATEAALRATEKALRALFQRVNVNQPRDPEFDAVLEAFATILHGLEHARGDRSNELQPPPRPYELTMSAEDVPPENDPFGEPTAVKLFTQDAGETRKVLAAVIRKPGDEPDA
jgi:hypothetical protein